MAEPYQYQFRGYGRDKKKFLIGMLAILIVVTFAFEWTISGYIILSDIEDTDFSGGTFTNASWNGAGYIEVSGSNNTGLYTSAIKDAGSPVSWDNITWGTDSAASPPSDSLVLFMHMDEISGAIVDFSGYGNNGTYNGALYSEPGMVSNCIAI